MNQSLFNPLNGEKRVMFTLFSMVDQYFDFLNENFLENLS